MTSWNAKWLVVGILVAISVGRVTRGDDWAWDGRFRDSGDNVIRSRIEPVQEPLTPNPEPMENPTSNASAVDCLAGCVLGEPCCSPAGRFWVNADYLLWWTNGVELPPLVAQFPPGTPIGDVGDASTVIFGNEEVNNDLRSGFRIRTGMWLDHCHCWAIEGDYFKLSGDTSFFTDAERIIRPAEPDPQLVSFPDFVEGTIRIEIPDDFQSAGIWLRRNLCCCNGCGPCGGRKCAVENCDPCTAADACAKDCLDLYCCRTDLIVGYRYYNLRDRLTVREDLMLLPPIDARIRVEDNFEAENRFHGVDIGLMTELYRGRWSLDLLAKAAIGNTHREVLINGHTTISRDLPPSVIEYDQGVFAVRTNSGLHTRDELTVIPHLAARLNYQWNRYVRTHVGYDLLYWASVYRAAEQYDTFVDPKNVPPEQDPALPFPRFLDHATSFWAQGLSAGLELRF